MFFFLWLFSKRNLPQIGKQHFVLLNLVHFLQNKLCFLTVDTSPVYGGDLEHTAAVLS